MDGQAPSGEVPISDSRIPKHTLLVVLWGGVGISMIFVAFRAWIRLRLFRKFTTDDYFLAVAWSSLLSNAVLWQVRADDLYFTTALVTGRITSYPTNIATLVDHYLGAILGSYIVQYIGLWCIKFSFLFFFRGLGTGIRRQMILWWCTCAFIIASFLVCLGTIDYTCLASNYPEAIESCTRPRAQSYEFITIRLTTSLDVLTDASIIGLSTNILWRVRISLGRKLALVGICSVTIFIITVAITRVCLATSGTQLDLTTVLMWGGVELSVAVITACLASFRSLYTASKNEKSKETSKNKNRSRTYQTMSDGIPLQNSRFKNSNTDSRERIDWTVSKGDAAEDMTPEPGVVYIKKDYELHTAESVV